MERNRQFLGRNPEGFVDGFPLIFWYIGDGVRVWRKGQALINVEPRRNRESANNPTIMRNGDSILQGSHDPL